MAKAKNQPKEKKTLAERIQLRLNFLDKKSANISKQIASLQKKLDDSNKIRAKIETLKSDLTKTKRVKELELDEIALMCSTYGKQKQLKTEHNPVAIAPTISTQ